MANQIKISFQGYSPFIIFEHCSADKGSIAQQGGDMEEKMINVNIEVSLPKFGGNQQEIAENTIKEWIERVEKLS